MGYVIDAVRFLVFDSLFSDFLYPFRRIRGAFDMDTAFRLRLRTSRRARNLEPEADQKNPKMTRFNLREVAPASLGQSALPLVSAA